MGKITLTVTSEGGQTVASVSKDFEVADMHLVEARNSGTVFGYIDRKGNPIEVVVSESYSAVQELMETVSTSTGRTKQVKLLFDATGGKAIGTYDMVDADTGAAVTLPDNAIITRSWRDVLTTFTSATDAATIALGVETDDAGGIVAANDIADAGNPWDAGLHDCIQDGAAANFSTKTTADGRNIQAVVAVEALTAGKLILVCEYTVTA